MDVINVSHNGSLYSDRSSLNRDSTISEEDEDYGNRNVHISMLMLSNFISVVDEHNEDHDDL